MTRFPTEVATVHSQWRCSPLHSVPAVRANLARRGDGWLLSIDSSTRSRPGVNADLGIDPHNPPLLPSPHGTDAEATARSRGDLDDANAGHHSNASDGDRNTEQSQSAGSHDEAHARELVEERRHAAQDAGLIDEAGRVPVEESTTGERTRGWPYDDTGYRVREDALSFVARDDRQVEWWQRFEAPLGMTPEQFQEFTSSLNEALAADGIDPAGADIRLQGSSAQFFSGSHKDFPTEHDLAGQPEALAKLREWMGDRPDADRPARIPFDAKHLLGVKDENGMPEPPSDYDVQISSDVAVDKARQEWERTDPETREPQPIHPKCDFISGVGSGISTHFRDTDWIINRPGGTYR